MLLSSLLLIPIIGVFVILVNKDRGVSLKNIVFIVSLSLALHSNYILLPKVNIYIPKALHSGFFYGFFFTLANAYLVYSPQPRPHNFNSLSLQSNIQRIILINILLTIRKYFVRVFINTLCKIISFYLKKLCKNILNEYPSLYVKIYKIISILGVIFLYFSNVVSNVDSYLKNKYPVFYSIFIYIWSEYLYILSGNISRNA